MSIPGIRFITSNTPGSGNGVGIGLSAVRGPTGPAGAFGGPQGNIGVQGATGSQGPQGLIGLQGLIGPTGTIGINGVQGLQGLIGSTGSKGNDGSQGLLGATGSIGLQGGAGMGFVVFANTTSYTGLNTVIATGGNIGQFVLVLGGDLFVYAGTGSGYTGPDNSYGYAGDVTDESKLYGTQGSVGLQGYQGHTGLQGYQGYQGETGMQGYQGYQGHTGSIGLTGLQGPTGIGIILSNSGTLNSIVRFNTENTIKDSSVILGDIGDIQNVANINFLLNTGSSTTPGTLYWDGEQNTSTLSLVMNSNGVVQQIGEETYFRVKAQTSITNGQVVMFAGSVGDSQGLLAAPASGIIPSNEEYIMGIATEDIPTNSWGFVTHFGVVRGINTLGGSENWVDGQLVYYNPSSIGGLTKYIPTGSNPKILLAAVMRASSNGSLFVRPAFGGVLGQYEGDVYIENKSTGDYLYYNGNYWTNKQLLLHTGSIGPQGLAGPVAGQSSQFIFNQSGAATGSNRALTYLESSTGGLIYAGSSIIPSQDAVFNLGAPDKLWKSIYISTGTIFIGPTGTLGLDNNGVISSAGGFASPFITVGSTNPGSGITLYNNQNKLWFQNQSGATGPISNWNIASNSINNIYFTGGNIGIGTNLPNYPLTVKGTIYCEGLTGTNLPIGLQGPTGLAGPQGIAGSNGAYSSLTLYLDTAGGSYAGVALTGTLMTIPNQSTQTTITSGNQSNTTINIANFISGNVPSTIIGGGNWDLGLFGFANVSSAVSFYFEVYYTDSDGVSNQTLLAAGTGSSAVFLPVSQTITTNSLYVPATVLPDTTHRILIKIFLIFSGNNRTATIEFRDGTISHLHTTILSPNIAAGQSTQIIFNQSGAYTGASNLIYNYTNNVVTLPNVIASSGSFTNLLLSSANIHLGGSAGSVNQKANSVAIGNSAGQTNQGTGAGTSGYSVAIGHLSGNNNQGYGSVSIGYSSGQTSQGELSVSIGTSSGNISQGTRAVGIGQGAGYQRQGNYAIAMGDSSGQDYQGTESVAIGRNTGLTYQNPYSVAIGSYAGSSYQSTGNVNAGSVAVGSHSGQTLQQYQAVALGYYAGNQNQGANSVAIGANAGYQNQANNSIVINASGNQINGTGSGLFVNPVRNVSGGNLLTYNTANSEVSYSNTLSQVVNISANNNATGSATGALVVTGGINVNGESVFNNLVYAPQLNPNFINRGNPGQASPLLLSNYNTVHYYSTTSATGFVDISTTMVENAVYEVEFNIYGASASNDDMFLYPNYNPSPSGTTFYTVYTQSSGSPSITYTTNVNNGFYFDYVSGSIGYEPVGKIKIYNNRSAKKIKVEVGDTTAVVNGQGYWTSGSGFTSNSVTNIVYDTATQWNNIGRILFSASGNVTFTNWNIWVKRIM